MKNFSAWKRLGRISSLQDENLRRRAAVLTILFIATIVVLSLALCSVMLGYITGANHVPNNRLLGVATALSVTAGLYTLLRKGKYFIAAYGIIGIYGALATVAAIQWSINLPSVSLLYCIVIVLSGIVLGARYSLYAALVSAALLFGIQLGAVRGVIHSNVTWYSSSPHLIDLIVYYLVFTVLSVISWLFNQQTDSTLFRALKAEDALEQEKEGLAQKLETRTRALEAAQLEKMGQLYRFAQLGQFTTSLLHDLANHMSTLSLDIEGMAEQRRHSQLEQRLKQRIRYIDNMVHWAYQNINGEVHVTTFSVKHEVREVCRLLQHNARQARVRLHCKSQPRSTLYVRGDPNRFRQVMTNLITNAIDAYASAPTTGERAVTITMAAEGENGISITVSDRGGGIPKGMQERIFQPFYSTKHHGMGIGLFVVKQLVEEHFSGTVTLTTGNGETSFKLRLRGAKHA